jgi:hypothetical protein
VCRISKLRHLFVEEKINHPASEQEEEEEEAFFLILKYYLQ